jgi:8-oxo-dGTP pyrophosphatase MutT (NUDIX family)
LPQPEPQQESESATSPEPKPSPARLRPRDAATLIVLDRRGKGGPKVLMGRRNPRLAFMPGQFVFPGGRIELGDRHMPVAGALPPHHLGRALALAAIRETYEETGLLLGTSEHGAPETAPAGWEAFARHGILPDLEALHLVARAITPPKRVRRFDTRFFAVDRRTVAAEEPGRVTPTSEFTELAWVRFDAARKLDLPFITRAILDDLEAQIAVDFAPYRMIPFHYERYGRRERVAL